MCLRVSDKVPFLTWNPFYSYLVFKTCYHASFRAPEKDYDFVYDVSVSVHKFPSTLEEASISKLL